MCDKLERLCRFIEVHPVSRVVDSDDVFFLLVRKYAFIGFQWVLVRFAAHDVEGRPVVLQRFVKGTNGAELVAQRADVNRPLEGIVLLVSQRYAGVVLYAAFNHSKKLRVLLKCLLRRLHCLRFRNRLIRDLHLVHEVDEMVSELEETVIALLIDGCGINRNNAIDTVWKAARQRHRSSPAHRMPHDCESFKRMLICEPEYIV